MMARAIKHSRESREPFSRALGELLRERGYTDSMGNPNLHGFAQEVNLAYEVLRRAAAGQRQPTLRIMEEVAEALGIDPMYFIEYRVGQMRKQFDVNEVGFEQMLENFDLWAAASKQRGKAARRRRA